MSWTTRLLVVFGVIVTSFVAATVFTQWQLASVDEKSRSIANDYAPSIEHLATATRTGGVTRDIELEASRSRASAVTIERAYGRARVTASLMSFSCVAIALIGALGLSRAFRIHSDLEKKHAALLEERASELEAFAGRVAHDILSPLGVVSLSLSAVSASESDDERAKLADRGKNAVRRIDRLVTGLLAFAVAGAKPGEDASADVSAVMADLAPELREAAKSARAELELDVDVAATRVACNAGVLTSIVSNLAHNALKYLGDRETRRVIIRAHSSGDVVRIEVEDTGPGLPPGLEARVFEPYVRGKNTHTTGIGLGLATVKRATTAHGGDAGVISRPDIGCTFWVELPIETTDKVETRFASLEMQ